MLFPDRNSADGENSGKINTTYKKASHLLKNKIVNNKLFMPIINITRRKCFFIQISQSGI